MRYRAIVTLFPNSTAPGINRIAYGLMGKRLGSFSLTMRAMQRAKFTPRPVRALGGGKP